jgi:hypothetical protein
MKDSVAGSAHLISQPKQKRRPKKMKLKKMRFIAMAAACALIAAGAAALLYACGGKPDSTEIVLNFDKSTAYFTAAKALAPIKGGLPVEGEHYEEASVKMTADEAVKMRLTLVLDAGETAVPGLAVQAGDTASAFADGMTLYVSEAAEKEATVVLKIFLAADAPSAAGGRTVKFTLKFEREEG